MPETEHGPFNPYLLEYCDLLLMQISADKKLHSLQPRSQILGTLIYMIGDDPQTSKDRCISGFYSCSVVMHPLLLVYKAFKFGLQIWLAVQMSAECLGTSFSLHKHHGEAHDLARLNSERSLRTSKNETAKHQSSSSQAVLRLCIVILVCPLLAACCPICSSRPMRRSSDT